MALVKQDDTFVICSPDDMFGSGFSLVQNADGLWNATLMGKQGGRKWGDFSRNDKV